jgi:hypothetical protein
MQKISCVQPPVDISHLNPEDQQLFDKFVHDLRKKDKWLTLGEAQRQAYQIGLVESMTRLLHPEADPPLPGHPA